MPHSEEQPLITDPNFIPSAEKPSNELAPDSSNKAYYFEPYFFPKYFSLIFRIIILIWALDIYRHQQTKSWLNIDIFERSMFETQKKAFKKNVELTVINNEIVIAYCLYGIKYYFLDIEAKKLYKNTLGFLLTWTITIQFISYKLWYGYIAKPECNNF